MLLCTPEPIPVKFFVDFQDYFGLGSYTQVDITLGQKNRKSGSKEPENRQKLSTGIGSYICVLINTFREKSYASSPLF